MSIVLTQQQQQALDATTGDLPRVVDPRTNAAYILVPESDFDSVREVLEEEHQRQRIHAIALRNAVGRTTEEP